MENDLPTAIKAQIQARIAARAEADMLSALTSTIEPAKPQSLTLDDITRIANRIRVMRRNDIVIVVCPGLPDGTVIKTEHLDGRRFEMSWHTARALHEQWPLVLSKVISKDEAEFRPANQFDPFVPKILGGPCFDLPDEDE